MAKKGTLTFRLPDKKEVFATCPEGHIKTVYLQKSGKKAVAVNFRNPLVKTVGVGILSCENKIVASFLTDNAEKAYEDLSFITSMVNGLIDLGTKNITLPEFSTEGIRFFLENAQKIYDSDIENDRVKRDFTTKKSGLKVIDDNGNEVGFLLRSEHVEAKYTQKPNCRTHYTIGIAVAGRQNNVEIYDFGDIAFSEEALHNYFFSRLKAVCKDINDANYDSKNECVIVGYETLSAIGKAIAQTNAMTRSMTLYHKICEPLMHARVAKAISVAYGEDVIHEKAFHSAVSKCQKAIFPILKKAYDSGITLPEIVDAVNTGSDPEYPMWRYINRDFKAFLDKNPTKHNPERAQ